MRFEVRPGTKTAMRNRSQGQWIAAPAFTFGFFIFLVLAALAPALQAQEQLHYLRAGLPDPATVLAPPPLPGSEEQAADMAQVVATHNACTSNQAALAFSEKPSLLSFTPAVGGLLEPGKFPKTEAFLQGVRKDAAAATGAAKQYWKRPRPYTVEPSLAAGKLEKSFGYPSGHSTEAMVLAMVLGDLFPQQREEVLAIGRNIGWHRVWIARHYPTDIYAGRVFAQAILRELKASPEFQRDLAEVRVEIAAETSKPAHQLPEQQHVSN
jgi:acid phosphatase (class A)